jgi:hypothetical protein
VKEDQREERKESSTEEGSEMVVKFQPSFLTDVPPRIMTSSWGLLFADIMRDVGSRPDIANEVEWNRLVLRGFWAKNPGTEFVATKMRAADSVEEAIEIFADWMVSEEMPAADTISRKLREAKNYLRARGELARGDMDE